MRFHGMLIAASLLLAGCQNGPHAGTPPAVRQGGANPTPSPSLGQEGEAQTGQITGVIKVRITADGEISADGQQVTLEQLAAKFAELKQAGGAVYYYRENSEDEPHLNALKVIELVVANGLPVRLSARPDFSDVVGP